MTDSDSVLLRLVLLVLFVASCPSQADQAPVRPGDHVAIIGNTYADQLRIHGYLEAVLRLGTAHGDPIKVRNLGWAGDTLVVRDRPTNFPTELSTLEAFGTDVLIACFGMGESFAGEDGLADFRKDLLDFLATHDGKSYNGGKSIVRLVLISPLAYENLGALTPSWERRNRELVLYSEAMAGIAAERKIPFVDLCKASAGLMEEPGAPDLTTNGITLNDYGYWALSSEVAERLVEGSTGWNLKVDLAKGANPAISMARGLEVDAIEIRGDGLAFIGVTEKSAPSIAPPGGLVAQTSMRTKQDVFTVSGLSSGRYTLAIEGHEMVSASAEDWARGVVLCDTPAHRALDAYRKAINDKNQQFTYAWKANNQVHIVGERRSSPSGRALPAELKEFETLVLEREAALAGGISLGTRNWTLTKDR